LAKRREAKVRAIDFDVAIKTPPNKKGFEDSLNRRVYRVFTLISSSSSSSLVLFCVSSCEFVVVSAQKKRDPRNHTNYYPVAGESFGVVRLTVTLWLPPSKNQSRDQG